MGTVRVAVVGTNFGAWWGRVLARHPEVSVTAVCDVVEAKAEKLRQELGAERCYALYEQVLDDPNLDAVMLATPAPLHATQAVQALDAGKHILSCMPAAITLDECRDLLAAVPRSGKVYMLAEPSCYYPHVRGVKRLAQEGVFGQIYYAEVEYLHGGDEQLLLNPDGSLAWRASFPPILYMSHGTGPLISILGEPFVEAFAYGCKPENQKWPRDATQVALFKTRSGAVCRQTNQFDTLVRPPLEYLAVYGSNGCFEQARSEREQHKLFLKGFSEFSLVSLNVPERTPIPVEGGHAGGEVLIVCEFVDAVLGRRPVTLDVRTAVDFSLPGICATESVRTGQPVRIPQL